MQYAVKPAGAPTRAQVRRWLAAALERDAEVAVRIVGAEEGQTLNHDYRHKNYATNVLTFCYDDPPSGAPLMGDLVLCAPVVEREAAEQGKSLEAHYCHLLVHGALHLRGFGHEADDEAECMEALETQIVTDLGYPAPYG